MLVRLFEHGKSVSAYVELITIRFAFRAEARIEIVGSSLAKKHAYIVGQFGVDGVWYLLARNGSFRIEMHHLPKRVYSRVRSSACGRLRGRGKNLCQRLFQHFLYAQPVELTLPAHVVCTEIRNYGTVSHSKLPNIISSIFMPTEPK